MSSKCSLIVVGGLIVLAMFINGWSIDESTDTFEKLAKLAFQRRKVLNLPFLPRILELLMSYLADGIYPPENIEAALKQVFGANRGILDYSHTNTNFSNLTFWSYSSIFHQISNQTSLLNRLHHFAAIRSNPLWCCWSSCHSVMAPATPVRFPNPPDPNYTHPPDLPTPSARNLRGGGTRASRGGQDATLNGGSAAKQPENRVSTAISRHLQEAQEAARLRFDVTTAFAKAIDGCTATFQSPQAAKIAEELQQRMIDALTSSPTSPTSTASIASSGRNTPATTSTTRTAASRTWADIARDPQNQPRNSGNESSGTDHPRTKRAPQTAAARPTRPAQTRPIQDDLRLFIAVSTTVRLMKPSPFAVRQAICGRIEGLTLQDIPTASPISTGWSITPANKTIRDLLLTQENRESLMRALDGDSVRQPELWTNYAVQGVASSYKTLTGEDIPTTQEMIEEEAKSQTGHTPVNTRPSRHGPNTEGLTTWIISYKHKVRSFRLFGTSDYAKEIRKRPQLQRHYDGCQGYCNPARCTRAVRCGTCGQNRDNHTGTFGDDCTHPEKCANCLGPHKAGFHSCPAAPRRENGRIIKLTKIELRAVRRIGQQAYERVKNAVETRLSQASQTPPTGSSAEAQPLPLPHPQGITQGGSGRETANKRPRFGPPVSLSASEAEQPSRHPRKAKNRQSLNLRQLSAKSLQPRTEQQRADHTDPSTVEEDTNMSDEPVPC